MMAPKPGRHTSGLSRVTASYRSKLIGHERHHENEKRRGFDPAPDCRLSRLSDGNGDCRNDDVQALPEGGDRNEQVVAPGYQRSCQDRVRWHRSIENSTRSSSVEI
jgi:hypothetical protein